MCSCISWNFLPRRTNYFGAALTDVGPSETTDIKGDPLRSVFAGQYCGGNADSNGGGANRTQQFTITCLRYPKAEI